MAIPKKFGDLTIEQYQQCTLILEDNDKPLFIRYNDILDLLQGSNEDRSLTESAKLIGELGFIHKQTIPDVIYKHLYVKGKFYKASDNVEDLTSAQVIALKHFQDKGHPVQNLHDLLACVYIPLKWLKAQPYDGSKHVEIAEAMKQVKIKYTYGLLFFYSIVCEKSNPNILNSFQNASKMIEEMMKEINQTSQESEPS